MVIKEFKLPDVGEGVAEGELVQWLVEPGDEVSEDQPVAEVETDKALVEVPSPYDGHVEELRAEEGEIVPVGTVIITFDVPGAEAEESDEGDEEFEFDAAENETDEAESVETDVEPETEVVESGGDVLHEFKLPDVGEGVAEGELVSWLVEPGDEVSEDQPVAEVETDKALVEVPSPYDGHVEELHFEEGAIVPVGSVLVTFRVAGEGGEGGTEAPAEAEDAAVAEAAIEAEDGAESPGGRVFAPPSARRLARELGVDITDVEGSGPGGRIREEDVRAHAEGADEEEEKPEPRSVGGGKSAVSKAGEKSDGASAAADAETTSVPSSVEAAGRERTLAAPATRRVADEEGVDLDDVPTDETRDGEAFVTAEQVREYAEAQRKAREAEVAAETAETAEASAEAGGAESTATPTETTAEGEVERRPYRGVRRTIGQQMERSKYTAPHVSHHDTAEISSLVETRAELKARAEEKGVKLTYMPFVMKAIVAALKEYPILNSTLDEDEEEIVVKHYYNIGVAVATDAGLMVPVVKNVDEKSILELADELDGLVERARERKISREEMQGGTFTITNFGAIGGEYATPIINYPETAIMGLGAIDERPVVEDGEVVARETLPLSTTIDHRVIDGAEAAAFTNTVMKYLTNPKLLLLE